jgi:TPR repeat protein
MKGQSRDRPSLRWRCGVGTGVLREQPNDDPPAAFPLGWTYDPAELTLGIPNFQARADPSKARERYRRAADLGSAAAAFTVGAASMKAAVVTTRPTPSDARGSCG